MHLAPRSRPFVHAAGAVEIRAAIAAITRALATAIEREQVLELVRERAALRSELDAIEENANDRMRERAA